VQKEKKQKQSESWRNPDDAYLGVAEETSDDSKTEWRLDATRFSSWKRLVRVYGWVYRFIDNCRNTKRKQGELDADEIKDAEEKIIRDMQIAEFPEYKVLTNGGKVSRNSKLLPLNPVIDTDGVLRCDGRLQNAEYLSHENRNPIILPRKNHVTGLIVRKYHEESNHSGTNYTLSKVSSRFWVIHAREEIREIERNCAECR